MRLKILSWNCQSAQNKVVELSNFLNKTMHHIVLLQETWLNPKVQIKIPNYVCLRQDRNSDSRYPHGGVAILVHSSLQNNYSRVKFVDLNSIESIFIQLTLNTFSFTIGSIYASSSLNTTESKIDLEKLFSRPGPFVLAGDYNAKHTSWNNVKSDGKGNHLLRICEKNLCEIHFSDDITAFPSVGSPSLLDFAVTKGIIGISKPIVYNDLSSDHLPITFEIPTTSLEFPEEIRIKSFVKANWKLFRTIVNAEVEIFSKSHLSMNSPDEIDVAIETFSNIISNAINKTVPTHVPRCFRYPNSKRIQTLIKRRNAYRELSKKFQNAKFSMRDLNREIRLETIKLRQMSWNNLVASLKIEDLSFFKITKSLKNKRAPVPPLNVAGDIIFSEKKKADEIAKKIYQSHLISRKNTIHSHSVNKSKTFINQSLADVPESEKITLREVMTSIESLKIKKSPGHEGISCRVLKNIPASAVRFLTTIYNACLKTSYFPLEWKIGKVVAIPKPGKDHTLPESYRPITLLPIVGKNFEKLILVRMMEFESDNQVLMNQQFGFRTRHSTTQQVLRITETVAIRFNENKSTAMTLLDIEKAFDSVWHDALSHKLLLYGFPIYQLKLIVSFLQNRVFFVAINKNNSEKYNVPAGVPQGSPLSPFLFNIYINDIPIPKHCKVAVYADDTALISSIKNYDLPELVKRMDAGLTEIEEHFSAWKIKLNSAKTESILFSKSSKMKKNQNTNRITINGQKLDWKNSVKYLGVTLDEKLTFRANIANNHLRSRKAMALVYCLLKKTSLLSLPCKLTLYRSYIRPIMTYACPVFSNCAACHMQRLQILQNKCLRMATNSPFRTRISYLHQKTGIPTIKSFVAKLTEKFYENSAKSTNKLVSRLGDYSRLSDLTNPKHRLPGPT